ncbi:MAG: 4-(cytidine 5'-diphospho)-2-C-methyl-D-erythritol kinase, partial [Thermodesulfobacteriota bacterium]
MNTITLLSPAKVNLTLEVLGNRADGYHEIRSIMQPVDLFDEVKIDVLDGNGIAIETEGRKIPTENRNLAWKAADIFIKESGLRAKVKIFIKKAIPVGAGLGGGSSNAASVLVGLNKISHKLSQHELNYLSPKIGSDVAFFINCRSAVAEGIGEKITTIKDLPLFNYILINPGFEVSTRDTYRQWDKFQPGAKKPDNIGETITCFRKGEFPLRNDLEQAAIDLYPEIKALKELLFNLGIEAASMTGSGPTVFAVFKEEKQTLDMYNYLKASTKYKVFCV